MALDRRHKLCSGLNLLEESRLVCRNSLVICDLTDGQILHSCRLELLHPRAWNHCYTASMSVLDVLIGLLVRQPLMS